MSKAPLDFVIENEKKHVVGLLNMYNKHVTKFVIFWFFFNLLIV